MDSILRPYGTQNFSVAELCDFIDVHKPVQQARIISSATYVEKTLIAPHRCLLLEVSDDRAEPVWLCLDRKPTSGTGLASGKGLTAANDQVRTMISVWTN